MGGLGNQLFIYAAGKAYSLAYGIDLELGLDLDSPSIQRHGSLITDFVEPSRYVKAIRNDPLSKFMTANNLGSHYKSDVVGFDERLLMQSKKSVFSGYFQSKEYLERLRQVDSFSLTHTSPSPTYEKLTKSIDFLDGVALHVRRGDYLSPSNHRIGALSTQYYANAINRIQDILGNTVTHLHIFTDSPEMVVDEFKEFSAQINIYSPSLLSASESLLLMSHFQYFVGSNSSLSWWAGALTEGVRAFPDPWFRYQDQPSNILPTGWLRVNSEWL